MNDLENLDDETICSKTNLQMFVQPQLEDIEEEEFSLEDAFDNQDPE